MRVFLDPKKSSIHCWYIMLTKYQVKITPAFISKGQDQLFKAVTGFVPIWFHVHKCGLQEAPLTKCGLASLSQGGHLCKVRRTHFPCQDSKRQKIYHSWCHALDPHLHPLIGNAITLLLPINHSINILDLLYQGAVVSSQLFLVGTEGEKKMHCRGWSQRKLLR